MKENRYHHGNLREALLDSALQILSQPEVESITLRMLAGRLGVSRTAPYRHFRNKSALMAAVAARGFSQMRKTFREELQSEDPEKAICEIIEDYVQFAISNPRLYRIMFSRQILESQSSNEISREAQLTFDSLGRILGKLNLDVKTSSEANAAAWAMVHGMSILIMENLLAVNAEGEIFPAITSGGKPLTAEETMSQIRSAAGIIASGIAVTSREQSV